MVFFYNPAEEDEIASGRQLGKQANAVPYHIAAFSPLQLGAQYQNQRSRGGQYQASHLAQGNGCVQKQSRQYKGENRGAGGYHAGIGWRGVLHADNIAELVDAHAAKGHDDNVFPILFVNRLPGHNGGYEPEQCCRPAQAKRSHAHPRYHTAFHGPFAHRAHEPETQKRRQRNQVRPCLFLPVHADGTIAQWRILCNLYVVVYEACFSRAGAL